MISTGAEVALAPPGAGEPPAGLGLGRSRAWWWALGGAALVLALSYAPNFLDLSRLWGNDENYQHGFLVNADTIVLDGALEALVEFMDDHPKAGIAGSLLLSTDEEPQSSPFPFPGIATELDRGLRLSVVSKLLSRFTTTPKTDSPCRVDWVAGASIILRRTMLAPRRRRRATREDGAAAMRRDRHSIAPPSYPD
jgi:hypothetical protein